MKYRILLADADGTLFDFHKGEGIAIRLALEHFGIAPSEENIVSYARANAAQWKKLERGETTQQRLRVERFEEFLKETGFQADARSMSDFYVQALGKQCWPLPYAQELCRRVSEHMPIYLVTNGIAQVQRSRFEHCAISPFLSGLVISEEVGAAKPDPKMLFEALRMAGGVDVQNAVLLGDSLTADIAAANNAGMDSILFTGGGEAPAQHGATWAVKTLEEACERILSC